MGLHGMSEDLVPQFAGVRRPECDRALAADGGQGLVVWAEYDLAHVRLWGGEGKPQFCCPHVPDTDRPVLAAGCKRLAVVAEGDAVDLTAVAWSDEQLLA